MKNESSENIENNNNDIPEIASIADSDSEESDSEIDEDEVVDCSNYIRTTETDEEIKNYFKQYSEDYQNVLKKKGPNLFGRKSCCLPKSSKCSKQSFCKSWVYFKRNFGTHQDN